jgi:hypothetical protein
MGHQPIFEGDHKKEGSMFIPILLILFALSGCAIPIEDRVQHLEENSQLQALTIRGMLEVLEELINRTNPRGVRSVLTRPISYDITPDSGLWNHEQADPPGQVCVILDPLSGTSRNISCDVGVIGRFLVDLADHRP